jgi:hypothetical protein
MHQNFEVEKSWLSPSIHVSMTLTLCLCVSVVNIAFGFLLRTQTSNFSA